MNLRRGLSMPDCERFRQECNFSEDEEEVFCIPVKNKSRIQIADAIGLSVATVDRRIRSIKNKIMNVKTPED